MNAMINAIDGMVIMVTFLVIPLGIGTMVGQAINRRRAR